MDLVGGGVNIYLYVANFVTVRICEACYHFSEFTAMDLWCIQGMYIGGKRSPAILNFLYLSSNHNWTAQPMYFGQYLMYRFCCALEMS